ncbi:major facilitator superfamily transporter [Diplocarpon rosae]|nr:major facilitator superfamily transporter [Diplocarpon rosae]
MGSSLFPKKHSSVVSENTPLLGSAADEPTLPVHDSSILAHESSESTRVSHHVNHTPLPKLQIFLLCLARLVEPMAFFGIFPFINQMIKETGHLKEADVGFYSGFIESMFSFTQMLLMIQWGRASDRVGRKPVLVFSMAGVAVGTALFGLSKTIWQMVLFRCCAGVFSGTVVTIRAMITENSTPRTQARAFSLFAFSGNMGIFLGPVLGGTLQSPAQQYGGVFERNQFFRNYPYALPTLATGSVGIVTAILCAIWVKETLIKKPKSGDETEVEAPMSVLEIIRAPDVAYVLFIYGHVMLLGLGYTTVSTLLYYTSIPLGGYGFSPLQISFFLGTVGIAQGIWLLLFFPMLHQKYGTGNILRGCYLAWPFFFAASPLCNFFLRRGWTTAFWIVAPTFQIAGSGVAMGFTCIQLALNDVSPSPNTLGTLNALALTLVSATRTVGPAIFASMFAFGAHSQVLGGYLIWVVLISIALMGLVSLRWYPERAEGRLENDK